jgi:hypothetical protein
MLTASNGTSLSMPRPKTARAELPALLLEQDETSGLGKKVRPESLRSPFIVMVVPFYVDKSQIHEGLCQLE